MEFEPVSRWIANPSLLSEETLPVLGQLVEAYPYFQVARMLYLKNLAAQGDIRFVSELRKAAIYIPDRKALFLLIESERYGLQALRPGANGQGDKDDSFALIDQFLSFHANESTQSPSLLFEPSASSDYIFWSLTKGQEAPAGPEATAPLQHHDLIDSFIKDDQERGAGSRLGRPSPNQEPDASPAFDQPDEPQLKSLDDSCFTETLAHIYVKQKRYEKALQIIKNLSLNYPEKNIYFADQIRFLEKLIINTKK